MNSVLRTINSPLRDGGGKAGFSRCAVEVVTVMPAASNETVV